MAKKKLNLQEELEGILGSSGRRAGVSWSSCRPEEMHSFVSNAVDQGALVSFSRTRDGGALVLTVLHDDLEGGRHKDYISDEQAAADVIEVMASFWSR